jgi:hypothetical protein
VGFLVNALVVTVLDPLALVVLVLRDQPLASMATLPSLVVVGQGQPFTAMWVASTQAVVAEVATTEHRTLLLAALAAVEGLLALVAPTPVAVELVALRLLAAHLVVLV